MSPLSPHVDTNVASRQEANYGTLISSPHGRFKRLYSEFHLHETA